MKKLIFALLIIISLGTGCDSFLDRQPDEALTQDDIFKRRITTQQYLLNVYSYRVDEIANSGYSQGWMACSDEASIAYTDRAFLKILQCTWQPIDNTYSSYEYLDQYRGIREANYFMMHVYECPELTREEADIWYTEARFMRAFYYYNLLRVYGPIFLLGDAPIDFNTGDMRKMERSSWDECIDYVVKELDECAKMLPLFREDVWYGRATKGAALAAKSRLLLYSARPLFNGGSPDQKGTNIYADVVTSEGKHLFPAAYDSEKWKLAADAAKEVIDLNQYEILGEDANDPYGSLKRVFIERANNELIFTHENSAQGIRTLLTPVGVGGARAFGGIGVTQKLVDAFAMGNGYYPIKGYAGDDQTQPIIDDRSGYSETGFSTFKHPMYGDQLNTFKMYQNREPRFYVNVFWSGMTWHGGATRDKNGYWTGGANVVEIGFYTQGNSGPGNSHNYATTGCLAHKYIDPSLNSKANDNATGWGYISWPIFRYAEILLNYAEALNEYDPGNPDILVYLNKIRKRAGVPELEMLYSEAVGDQKQMRELIRRERMVELCFENQRYFDTRTWMIAEQTDNGAIYGMNVAAKNHTPTGGFWKRTPIVSEGGVASSGRIFQKKCYLFPFPQTEIDRVDFTQNYGW